MSVATHELVDGQTPQLPIIDGAEMRLAMEVDLNGPRKDDYVVLPKQVGNTVIREATGTVSVNDETGTIFMRPTSQRHIAERCLVRESTGRKISFRVVTEIAANALVVFHEDDILSDKSELIAPPLE